MLEHHRIAKEPRLLHHHLASRDLGRPEAARDAFNAAEMRMNDASRAVSAAMAALLTVENGILTRWRDQQARTIRQLQLDGAPDEVVTPKIVELKLMCPPDTEVRLHQRFTLSALVREVLDETPDALRIHTSIAELRGDQHVGYEKRRAQILAQAEAESNSPLEAA